MRYKLRKLLILLAIGPPAADSEEDEDDGLKIGWPVAMLINFTAAILLASLFTKWVGCR